MERITIYEKPTCTTCRKVAKKLQEMGVDFERVDYYIKPFSRSLLNRLLKKMGMSPSDLLRKNEQAFRDLKVKENTYSENQILGFMLKNHDLIQRPIIEKGEKAVLARPPEKIEELF